MTPLLKNGVEQERGAGRRAVSNGRRVGTLECRWGSDERIGTQRPGMRALKETFTDSTFPPSTARPFIDALVGVTTTSADDGEQRSLVLGMTRTSAIRRMPMTGRERRRAANADSSAATDAGLDPRPSLTPPRVGSFVHLGGAWCRCGISGAGRDLSSDVSRETSGQAGTLNASAAAQEDSTPSDVQRDEIGRSVGRRALFVLRSYRRAEPSVVVPNCGRS